DQREREDGGDHAGSLLADSDSSARRDQEQQPADDGRRQTRRDEEGEPTQHDLPLTAPAPALDRPEGELGGNEERHGHKRSAPVNGARPQAEKDGVSRTDQNEA